jgi:hypothetical protein
VWFDLELPEGYQGAAGCHAFAGIRRPPPRAWPPLIKMDESVRAKIYSLFGKGT